MRLHHVQVSCPPGGEAGARCFYGSALGLIEVAKPPGLSGRGGCWFRAYDGDTVVAEIHVGVEDPFAPAHKAHPALVVRGATDLAEVADRLRELGFNVDERERETFPGYLRLHTADDAGNRVEVLAPVP